MKRRSRIITISFSLAVAATAIASAIFQGAKRPPELVPPLAIGDVASLADGGSLYLVIEDEVGNKVLVGLKGSLDKTRSQFPVVFQRWHGLIPFGRQVSPGSEDEARILLALREWLTELPASAAYRAQLEELVRVIGARHSGKAVAMFGAENAA